MRNIIRIFTSDVKRLATNVVAVVVIMGLAVIPSLYAWFNIISNWDPYGEESTKNLNVVVASCDQGTEIAGVELNIGSMVVSNLKENDTIGWVFVDTEDEAVDGVESGDYYAALVIDESFSEDLISFLGGNIENPKITYYENEKKNAIAPKITSKVKTTVQEEINSAFVSTMAKALMSMSDYVVASDTETGSLTNTVKDKLESMDTDLVTYITIVDSYIAIIDSANSLMDATDSVTDQLDSIMQSGRSIANSADAAADAASGSVDTVSDMITLNLDNILDQIEALSDMVDKYADSIENTNLASGDQIRTIKTAVETLQSSFNSSMDKVTLNSTMETQKQAVNNDFDALESDLDVLADSVDKTSADAKTISDTLEPQFEACKKSIKALRTTYNDTVNPQLNATMNSIQDSISQVQTILNFSSDSIKDVSNSLNSYPEMLSFGKEKLESTRDDAIEMESKLQEMIADMNDIESNDQYNILVTLIESDPELIADFISSPVNLVQTPVYEMTSNGSATSPFYVILSIWFGALILIAIMHTGLKTNPGCKNLRNYQKFFGRYIVFYLIGQLQTIITVLGCLLYVGIQCEHPLMYWFAASFTSFTFTIFMYSLAYAFGNVGEAAAVVLMVIQVAGSGGTFPVEVLPKVFQYLYNYMPFAHGMNALRETIAGCHGNDYWIYLSQMLIYIGVALFFGLVISIPCKKLNEKIEESKERTDLLV